MSNFTLEDLHALIKERRASGDDTSYTRKLYGKGIEKIAKKVGEEGVEVALAAFGGDKQRILDECADLMYHLTVMLEYSGLSMTDVCAQLSQRVGRSGIKEKAARSDEIANLSKSK